jgi:hypothetical protein
MARYFGYDVITDAKAKLVADLNTNITTINSTRSTACPVVRAFRSNWTENQFPVCYIDLGDSEVENNENELNNDIELEVEHYELEVTIEHKSNKKPEIFGLEMEIFEEAISKTLHGYYNAGILWCIKTNTARVDVSTQENQTKKMVTVIFDVKVR